MASFVYGVVPVTLEQAGEAFESMETIAKAIASKEGREYVALPRGVHPRRELTRTHCASDTRGGVTRTPRDA